MIKIEEIEKRENSYRVWMACCAWLGFVGVFPCEPWSHWLLFEAGGRNTFMKSGWRVIWLAVVHGIWTYMNEYAFNGKVSSVDVVVDVVKLKSWLWLKHFLKGFVTTSFIFRLKFIVLI